MKKLLILLTLFFSITFTSANASEVSLETKITGLYVAFFNRAADKQGLDYWTQKGETAQKEGENVSDVLKELSEGFATHPTFTSTYAHLSNRAFVEAVYRNTLGREGDSEGIGYWTGLINNGLTRSDMVATFVETALTADMTPENFPSLTEEELVAAQLRQDLITNKVSAALSFTHQLGILSNIGSDDPESNPVYLASIKIISEVTEDASTVSDVISFLEGIKESEDPIKDINEMDRVKDPKYDLSYKGLAFYYQNKVSSEYGLDQLTDAEFNTKSEAEKLKIANNLLSTLFFGYPQEELQLMIDSGNFIAGVRSGMKVERTDRAWLENYILDNEKFGQYSSWSEPQAITILSRFYAMEELDSYFLKNWIAYILTQTILFSPAYELESTHTPNISGVYNRIVTFLNEESGMRYMTYVHMMSEDNWRRFRSPEDNGREMLEIYQLDMNDSHVPIAAKALQNWKLNTDSDTLEVSLNQNTEALDLFGTTIYNGDDFYRELVKADLFTKGVTARLVNFFFPEASDTEKEQIIDTIVSSKPETWQDILLQIVFSETYLLHNQRAKSAEEVFFSLAKKIDYKHRRNTFYYLKENLEEMHQASMKYKLGRLERVPLDTLSFANYHKFIREYILLRRSNSDKIDDYDAWDRQGWSDSFIAFEKFDHDSNSDPLSLDALVNYLFQVTVAREATDEELKLFRDHMVEPRDGKQLFRYEFNMFITYDNIEKQIRKREEYKRNIVFIVLDYISRLDVIYRQREVQ